MENILALFAILNCDDWCAAVIIHNFYYEALEKTKGKGDYISTFNIEDLAYQYGYRLEDVRYSMISLEEGRKLIEFKPIKYQQHEIVVPMPVDSPAFGRYYKERDAKAYEYTVNCENIRSKLNFCLQEIERVKSHNKRALELNHPATLTIRDWMVILSYYHYTCAYCSGAYDVLEHYIPLTFSDSGTTKLNCVPACKRCNNLKGPYHPERMPEKIKRQFTDDIANVQNRLRKLWPNG